MTAGSLATLIGTFVAVLTVGWSVIWSLLRRYLDARFETTDVKLDALETKMDTKLDALETKMGAKLDALETKMSAKLDAGFKAVEFKFESVDTKFKAIDTKFDAVDAKFETLSRQMDDNNRTVMHAITKIAEDQRQTQTLLTQLLVAKNVAIPDTN